MNESQKYLALAWLISHAQLGELNAGVDDDGRRFAVDFLARAMTLVPQAETPGELAVITHGAIEGEYVPNA